MAVSCPYHALILAPIRPDAPTGAAVDADRRWDELRESFSQPGTKPWDRMLQIGTELLTEVGKDTNVMSYVGLALFQVRGYQGLAEALTCWTDMLGPTWDRAWPEKAIRRKAGPLRFSQVINDWARSSPPPDDVPAEVLERCLEQLSSFEAAAMARLGEDAGPLDGVREALEQARQTRAAGGPAMLTMTPTPPAVSTSVHSPPPASPPAPIPSQTPAPPPVSTLVPPPVAISPPPPVPAPTPAAADKFKLPEGATTAQTADAFRQLRPDVLNLVERARALDPQDPTAYRIGRSWAWMSAALPARDEQDSQRTRLEFVHQQTAEKLRRLVDERAWAEALVVAEKIWPRSIFWLDPHHVAARALRELGHTAAAAAVEECVATLLRRLPGLADLHFADRTPLASEATRAWLQELSGRDTASPRPAHAPAAPPVAPQAPAAGQGPTDDQVRTLAACAEALRAGRPRDAAALLESYTRGLGAGRVAFQARVRFAHLLLDAGQGAAVAPLLAALDEEATTHQLDRWEPELAAELVSALLRLRGRAPGKPTPPDSEALRGRAARLGAFTLLFES